MMGVESYQRRFRYIAIIAHLRTAGGGGGGGSFLFLKYLIADLAVYFAAVFTIRKDL